MKKILSLLVAVSFFPVAAFAINNKNPEKTIKAKQALSYPLDCNGELDYGELAKNIYEKNKTNFNAVYNYAVVLLSGECGDDTLYFEEGTLDKVVSLFKTALKMKPNHPAANAGLGSAILYKADLPSAYFFATTANQGGFVNDVARHLKEAKLALSYYKKAIANGFKDKDFLPIPYEELASAVKKAESKKLRNEVLHQNKKGKKAKK